MCSGEKELHIFIDDFGETLSSICDYNDVNGVCVCVFLFYVL